MEARCFEGVFLHEAPPQNISSIVEAAGLFDINCQFCKLGIKKKVQK